MLVSLVRGISLFSMVEEVLPATYSIDQDQKLVVTLVWGPAKEAEIFSHNQKLRTDPLFDPTYRQLADMRGVTEILVSTKVGGPGQKIAVFRERAEAEAWLGL